MNYGLKAFLLNEVISHLNNEEAYFESGWLYIYPDGSTLEDCRSMFRTKADYDELYEVAVEVIKEYGKDGIYEADEEVVEFCNKVCEANNIPLVKVIK